MIRTLTIALLLATTAPLAVKAQEFYRFDAGAEASAVATGTTRLTPSHNYDAARGWGWVAGGTLDAFVRPRLHRSRNAWMIDGVAGRSMIFRSDVDAGTWWVTAWIESGLEDSTTLSVALNGEGSTPAWTAFAPGAEGRTSIQKIYRVLHRPVEVDDSGLTLAFEGGADSVRVLALSIFPDPQPATNAHRALIRRFDEAGAYGSTASLDSLAEDLRALADEDPFAAYWLEQVELLRQAEQYRKDGGWGWATDAQGLGLFDRFHGAVMLLDGLLDRPGAESWPFYERALFERGRLLYWLALERGGRNETAGGTRDLRAIYELYPEDERARMYVGMQVNQPHMCDELQPAGSAPEWSKMQVEALCRMRDEAHWWIYERQAENGELGGKLGDDVELLREWYSLILWGDPTTLRGYRRLADGVWNSDEIEDGYAREVSDVEHASEFISDTAPVMALFTDDPAYVDRLRPSARHFEHLWTGITPNGHRFFRSAWFSASEVDTEPPKNRDVNYNTRATKAMRFLAYATGDRHVIDLLHEWSRSWADAAKRTDKGKPAGITPASIRFPDEAINGDEPTWHQPEMYWNYFRWAHDAGSMILDQLLHTYILTGDASLLQPLHASLELVRTHADDAAAEPGSAAWAASRLRASSEFWAVVETWRLHEGDDTYDDLILQYGTPYARYRITHDEKHLASALELLLSTLRHNRPLRTSEVLHTDRVYMPGNDQLQAMLAGGGMENSPYAAVSWTDTDSLFTALVKESGGDRLTVDVFSHRPVQTTVGMNVHGLAPGTYRLSRSDETRARKIVVSERGQRIDVPVPPRQLVTITLMRDIPPAELAQRVADRLVAETTLRLVPVLEEANQDGSYDVDFFDAFGRDDDALYYARSIVRVDDAAPGNLALGISHDAGSAELWVDGRRIYRGDDDDAAWFDHLDYGIVRHERTVPVSLAPGEHDVLLKYAPSGGAAQVLIGIVDAATGIAAPGVAMHAPHFEDNDHFAFLVIGPFAGGMDSVHPPDTSVALGEYDGLGGRSVRWDKPRVHAVSALPERLDYSDWRYFSGTFLDAMRAASETFDGLDYTDYIDRHLDFFLDNRNAVAREREAYGLRESAFGHYFRFALLDDMGMQTVPFVERMRRGDGTPADRELVERVVDYIMNDSRRLADGTFGRLNPDSLTVWADDLFMGTVVLIRAARVLDRPELLDEAAEQALLIHERLVDRSTGLYWHGWSDRTQQHSSSKWARANGWTMMAKTELLQTLPEGHRRYDAVLETFRTHAAALQQVQTADGRWHQVIDNPDTYLETSATAMFVRAFAEGVAHGWLPQEPYADAAERGWTAITGQVREDGQVEGIVRGTPIFYSDQQYDDHGPRLNDPRGLGAVLYAAVAIHELRRTIGD